MIRPLAAGDVADVARVHVRAFADAALTQLGDEAVRRYYAWLASNAHPDAVRLGAWDGSRLVGFAFGGAYRRATAGFLERNTRFLVGRVARRPWLVATNPLVRSRATTAVRLLRRRAAPPGPATPPTPSYGILSIAVDPDARRSGVARALMAAHEGEARRRGFTRLHLTVHATNAGARSFYEADGWRAEGERGDDLTLVKRLG